MQVLESSVALPVARVRGQPVMGIRVHCLGSKLSQGPNLQQGIEPVYEMRFSELFSLSNLSDLRGHKVSRYWFLVV